MKKFVCSFLTVMLSLAIAGTAFAQGAKKSEPSRKARAPKAEKAEQKAPPAEAGGVTHAELAQMLVQIMGLSRFLPANPSAQEMFSVLLGNAVSPANGWQADETVKKADLARVVVQAMKRQGEVKNPDDPRSWIDFLRSIGIPMDAVGEAVSYVDPLGEPVVLNVASPRVDPLIKRHRYNPTDETQYGVDMEFVSRTISLLAQGDGGFRPAPVTQH